MKRFTWWANGLLASACAVASCFGYATATPVSPVEDVAPFAAVEAPPVEPGVSVEGVGELLKPLRLPVVVTTSPIRRAPRFAPRRKHSPSCGPIEHRVGGMMQTCTGD